jgi:threonine dehydrogenase-like Zn-dependent dehydrogenase
MGVVGQLTLQLARLTGCEVLAALDLVDMRLDVARESGATHAVNPREGNYREEVRDMTGGHGFDVIIEASGALEAIPLAVELAAFGGQVILLGSAWGRKAEVDFFDVQLKELTLVGCHQPRCPTQATRFFPWTQQYNRAQILRMINDGRLNVDRLITHRLPFTDASTAYEMLRENKEQTLGVILEWNAPEQK